MRKDWLNALIQMEFYSLKVPGCCRKHQFRYHLDLPVNHLNFRNVNVCPCFF